MKTTVRGKFIVALLTALVCVAATLSVQAQTPVLTAVQRSEAGLVQANAEKAVADRVAGESKAVHERTAAVQAATEQALAAAKASADKAAEVAKNAQGDAAKPAAEFAAKAAEAFKAAEQASAATKTAVDKAAAERAAAEKTQGEKTAGAATAARRVLAEKAFAANMALRQARTERAQADQALGQKVAAANQKNAEKAAADQLATNTANEKAAADKFLVDKTAATKTTLEQASAEKDEVKKKALQETAAKVEAERVGAEKAVAEKAAAAKVAADKAAAAKTAADQAVAEQTAAQQVVAQKAAVVTATLDAFTVAETEAVGGLKPILAGAWDYNKARHLLTRAGFGGPLAEVEKLQAMGLHAAVEYLVNYHGQPACNVLYDVRPPERPLEYENYLEQLERDQLNNERTGREQSQQAVLRQWWLRRMAETPRPLEEKLALFWHDHFATGYEDKLYQSNILYKQNELFRNYADKYEGLLRGIVHDSAMIIYLDNHVNVKGKVNENLGREVLELFTLGRDQGYTEQDLRELSRALTGYSYVPHVNMFRFNGTQHDEGPKTILGRQGNFSADEAIDVILQHPSTARYVAKKLFEFFAHRQPSDDTVNRLANVLLTNGYELGPMLKTLFMSEEFYSERAMAQQIKSPVELMVGTIRTLGLKDVNYGYVDGATHGMGMVLFQQPNVGGWEEGRTWISANRVLLRYNGVANLIEQPNVEMLALVEGKVNHPAELVDYLARACLASGLSEPQRKALIDFLGQLPPPAEWAKQRDAINAKLRALIVLIMSTPEYQVS